METTTNKYITVAYELYVKNEMGNMDLVEKTSREHPLTFISGMGFTLEAFEQHILATAEGEAFQFTVPVEEAYGEFSDDHVISLKKEIFSIGGKFDEARIYPGNVIPLSNSDGNHFDGIVKEVRQDDVVIDLNHPLAGKDLYFKGHVLESRPATNKEIEHYLNHEQGCGGCCGDCDDDDEQCGCHKDGCCCHGKEE